MDNKISDNDLKSVTGGIAVSEEAISGAIACLQKADALLAQTPISTLYGPRITDVIQALRSCKGDIEFYIIDDLDELERRILSYGHQHPENECRLYRTISEWIYNAKVQLGF